MASDLTGVPERVSLLEARFEEMSQTFRDHVERQERHQELVLKELGDIRQFLRTTQAIGRITIWFGGVVLVLISGLPNLIQWLHDHLVFKP